MTREKKSNLEREKPTLADAHQNGRHEPVAFH